MNADCPVGIDCVKVQQLSVYSIPFMSLSFSSLTAARLPSNRLHHSYDASLQITTEEDNHNSSVLCCVHIQYDGCCTVISSDMSFLQYLSV